MLAKLTVTQGTELRVTLTNSPLLEPPLRNTDVLQLDSRRSFLSFNSGGAELTLRATSKIWPENTPTAVPDFGGY